jgi:hypothetical protein
VQQAARAKELKVIRERGLRALFGHCYDTRA